jgi:20S proteasome subunit alpha 3
LTCLLFPIVELATLTIDEATGLPFAHIFKPAEIDAALEREGLAKKPEEAAATTA